MWLDETLGIQSRQQYSEEVKALGVLLCVVLPYELARELLGQLTGVKLSRGSLWNWVQESGKRASELWQSRLEAQEVPREALDSALEGLTLAIGADGVMVPFRPTPGSPAGPTLWQEVKVGVLARFRSGSRAVQRGTRLLHKRYVALQGPIDAFKPRLLWEAQHQGWQHAPQVVWLSDGGVGFWRLFHECFSSLALGILDFYHASSHLFRAAQAYAFDCPEQVHSHFEHWCFLLRHGHQQRLLQTLDRLQKLPFFPQPQRHVLQQVLHYLSLHQDHIAYSSFETQGFPLGSGFVESACKSLIQQRFKGVGMRWSQSGFDHLLLLRVEWANGRFFSLFPSLPPHPPFH